MYLVIASLILVTVVSEFTVIVAVSCFVVLVLLFRSCALTDAIFINDILLNCIYYNILKLSNIGF